MDAGGMGADLLFISLTTMEKRFFADRLTRSFALLLVFTTASLSVTGESHGQQSLSGKVGPFRTQKISLKKGWNAVHLEIEPEKGEPTALFSGTPIEIAAAYFRPVTSMEFIDDPAQVLPDRKSWKVWYAPTRDDALLSDLGAVQAHRSYLLYTEQAFEWSVKGTPFFGAAEWHPNAFSLVGFPLDAATKPTVEGLLRQHRAAYALEGLSDVRRTLDADHQSRTGPDGARSGVLDPQ